MRTVIVLLLTGSLGALAAQSLPASQSPEASPLGEPFAASWTASGQRQQLPTEGRTPAVTLQLSGSLAIKTGSGLGRGFRGEVIGFDDGAGVVSGRVVWTDKNGDQIFSVLNGGALSADGRPMRGTITGGTGRYVGIAGEYEFRWEFMVATEVGLIGGRAADLRGHVRRGSGKP